MVIKPEDKSLEASIYGKENSLAQDFNRIKYGENGKKRTKYNGVNMLDIKATHDHGSSVEFFEHDDIRRTNEDGFSGSKDDQTDMESIKDIIEFSSLLGLRDLHHENLVYSKADESGKRKMQLIDSEIALANNLAANNPSASIWNSEINSDRAEHTFADNIMPILNNNGAKHLSLNANNFAEGDKRRSLLTYEKKDIEQALEFMDIVKEKFKGKKSRVVLMATGKLYKFRSKAYQGDFKTTTTFDKKTFIEHLKESDTYKTLAEMAGGVLIIVGVNKIIDRTRSDFLKGRIPFWEYDFERGAIIQKFSDGEIVIAYSNNLKLDNVIEKRKSVLRNKYRLNRRQTI